VGGHLGRGVGVYWAADLTCRWAGGGARDVIHFVAVFNRQNMMKYK